MPVDFAQATAYLDSAMDVSPTQPAQQKRRLFGKRGDGQSPNLKPLVMIASAARKYPWQLTLGIGALLVTAVITSLALPMALRLIIDRGFGDQGAGGAADIGRWFRYLLGLVVVLGLFTALR